MIDWTAFDWQSFSTLATGGAAVIGATIIGRRQTQISRDQTTIIGQQTHIQELTLRSALWDRRAAYYGKVTDFIAYILAHADRPDVDTINEYLAAMRGSRFLFEPRVYTALDEIWSKATAFFALKSEMKMLYERHGHYGDGNPEKEHEALLWFGERIKSLHLVFHEMNLARIEK